MRTKIKRKTLWAKRTSPSRRSGTAARDRQTGRSRRGTAARDRQNRKIPSTKLLKMGLRLMQVIDGEQRTVGDPVAPSEDALHLGQQQPEEQLLAEHAVEDGEHDDTANQPQTPRKKSSPRSESRKSAKVPDRRPWDCRHEGSDGKRRGSVVAQTKGLVGVPFLRNAPSARQRWAVPRETPRSPPELVALQPIPHRLQRTRNALGKPLPRCRGRVTLG